MLFNADAFPLHQLEDRMKSTGSKSLLISAGVLVMLFGLFGCKQAVTASDPARPIVGTWKLRGGDYPLTNDVRADGTFVQRVGSQESEPSKWRVEGLELVISTKQPDGTTADTRIKYSVNASQLSLEYGDRTMTFDRSK